MFLILALDSGTPVPIVGRQRWHRLSGPAGKLLSGPAGKLQFSYFLVAPWARCSIYKRLTLSLKRATDKKKWEEAVNKRLLVLLSSLSSLQLQ